MSIADHFDRAPDTSFIRTYDSGTARRQLNMSFVLMMLVAFVIASLAIVVRFDSPNSGPANPTMETGSSPSYVGKL